jgi:hypothetical protein
MSKGGLTVDILNIAVPVVGAFGAFLLAIVAFKQRTLLDFFGRGIDQTKALSKLPDKQKLDGLEIIENTLKIENISTDKLTAEQTHSLILETLREKRRHARAKFTSYIIFSAITAILAIAYLYYILFYDTKTKIESALSNDKDAATDILSRFDFFSTRDPDLVKKLAAETAFNAGGADAYAKLMDKICANPKSATCNEVIRDLRFRAQRQEPPFNDVGIPVKFGTLSGPAQPKRFTLHVSPSFEYARRAVEVSYRGKRLILYAEPKMGTITNKNFVHLNISQADAIDAPRANTENSGLSIDDAYKDSGFIVVIPQSNPTLFDPSCPDYWDKRRNPSLCLLGEEPSLTKYLSVAANLK